MKLKSLFFNFFADQKLNPRMMPHQFLGTLIRIILNMKKTGESQIMKIANAARSQTFSRSSRYHFFLIAAHDLNLQEHGHKAR
jgi:hypothetical protein